MNYTERMEDALFEVRGYDENDEATSEKILNFLNEAQSFRSFGDALSDLIVYKKGDSTGELPKEILKRCAKEQGISMNRNTVSNWFDGLRPKKGEQSREHMYMIAFALELNYEETCELFRKVYYDRPFNMRSPKEYIYLYCILSRKTYQTAKMMIKQVNICDEDEGDKTLYTKLLSEGIKNAASEKDVIDYIYAHSHNFMIDSKSAKGLVGQLIYQIKGRDEEKEKLRQGTVDENCSLISRECAMNEGLLDDFKSLTSISSMIDIILGINLLKVKIESQKSWFKSANLPREIINRFPTKHTFSKENPSSEELRKIIILLFSYKFWFEKQYEDSGEDLDDYICQVDEVLDTVGLQTLYYGNPFDWMFMYCSMDERPLDIFRNIMADAFSWE